MLAATNNVDEAIVTAAGSLFTKALIEQLKMSAASGSSMCVTEFFSCLRHNRLLLQQSPHHDQLRDQQFPIPIQPLVPQDGMRILADRRLLNLRMSRNTSRRRHFHLQRAGRCFACILRVSKGLAMWKIFLKQCANWTHYVRST